MREETLRYETPHAPTSTCDRYDPILHVAPPLVPRCNDGHPQTNYSTGDSAIEAIKGMPVLEGVDVTVMMTPARFATIRRAARRDIRKCALAYVSMGRTNSSTSNPTSGTPWRCVLRMPTALNKSSPRAFYFGKHHTSVI